MVEPLSKAMKAWLLERMITTARITIFLFVESVTTLEEYYDHRVTIGDTCIRLAIPVSCELFSFEKILDRDSFIDDFPTRERRGFRRRASSSKVDLPRNGDRIFVRWKYLESYDSIIAHVILLAKENLEFTDIRDIW